MNPISRVARMDGVKGINPMPTAGNTRPSQDSWPISVNRGIAGFSTPLLMPNPLHAGKLREAMRPGRSSGEGEAT